MSFEIRDGVLQSGGVVVGESDHNIAFEAKDSTNLASFMAMVNVEPALPTPWRKIVVMASTALAFVSGLINLPFDFFNRKAIAVHVPFSHATRSLRRVTIASYAAQSCGIVFVAFAFAKTLRVGRLSGEAFALHIRPVFHSLLRGQFGPLGHV